MKIFKRMTVTGLVIAALMLNVSVTAARSAPSELQAVHAAVTRFYSALNVMFAGQVGPMKDVWSHADDVTYMGPGGGIQVGWTHILATWQKQADMKLGGKVVPSDEHVILGSDVAVVIDLETGENLDKAGKPLRVSIRATNVFRKENDKWKMVGHHTDLLPYLQK